MASVDFQGVANQFIPFYYQTFDTARDNLASLYRDESMLTWESASVQGTKAILEKLTSLPFRNVSHEIATTDAQPNGASGILIQVTGIIAVDDGENKFNFSQTFQLLQDQGGNWFVMNQIFKLFFPPLP